MIPLIQMAGSSPAMTARTNVITGLDPVIFQRCAGQSPRMTIKGRTLFPLPQARGEGISSHAGQIERLIHSTSLLFGAAPTWVEATCPFLNSIRVGIPRTP